MGSGEPRSMSQLINNLKYGLGLKDVFFSSASFWMTLTVTDKICPNTSYRTIKYCSKYAMAKKNLKTSLVDSNLGQKKEFTGSLINRTVLTTKI